MGEKFVRVVFGAFVEEMGPCPDEDGWNEWVHKLEEFGPVNKHDWGIFGVPIEFPYESTPPWLGFQVEILNYGETWSETGGSIIRATKAWGKLREFGRAQGLLIPPGKVIVALDG